MPLLIVLLITISTICSVCAQDTLLPVITVTVSQTNGSIEPTAADSTMPAKNKLMYPILFVHDFASSPEAFGFDVGDEFITQGRENNNTYIYRYFVDGDCDNSGYPRSSSAHNLAHYYGLNQTDINHNFLESFNATDRNAANESGINNQTNELYERMVEVLDEYYGFGWELDLNKKLILVCHSQGGLLARNLFTLFTDKSVANAAAHIERVVTLGTPFRGAKVLPVYAISDAANNPFGPYRVTSDMAGKQMVLATPDQICITGHGFSRCFFTTRYTSAITIPETLDCLIDPIKNVRDQISAMRGAAATFDPESGFIRNLQKGIALNPATSTIQPWVFVKFKDSKLINDLSVTTSFLCDQNQTGDLVVPFESQSLFDKYPAAAHNSAVFEIDIKNNAWHGSEPGLYPAIIGALSIKVRGDLAY